MKFAQTSEEFSNVNLLISLLVRFPEIFTINYNVVETKFKLTFMLKINIPKKNYIQFIKEFYDSVKVYNQLSGINESLPVVNKKAINSWTLLQVTLQKKRISFEEVNLISRLILNKFKNDVIIDIRNGSPIKKERTEQEEFIDYLFSKKNKKAEKNLFAFRDAGKVYIFDK